MNAPAANAPSRRAWTWLVAGLLFGLVWCLGTRGLNEPDEGRYASMARAMVETGDWWTPRLSGYEHYDKPPLVYWATALSLKAFGFNEWAARLPSLLGAVGALAGLGWTASRLHGPRVAWWALLVCGTSVQFWVCARLITPDMPLTGWTTLAVGAWAECRHRGGAWRWWLLSLTCWTLAWWTKATPALVPMLGLAAGTLVTRDRAGWRALRLPLLLPATVLLGLPWYAAMLRAHPDLRGFFLGKELAGRLAGGAHRRGGPLFYYLPVSAVAWLPWWPLAAWAAGRTRAAGWARRIGVEGWIVTVGLLVFSVNGSKLPTYTLVLAPWAALFLARLILKLPRVERAAAAAAGVFALLVLPGAWLAPRWESRLGRNASVREVCQRLAAVGAGSSLFDSHWPGAEFYRSGPGQARFVADDRELRERGLDPGPAMATFLPPEVWREEAAALPGPVWTVRYRKARKSPFPAGGSTSAIQVGDFELRPSQRPAERVKP